MPEAAKPLVISAPDPRTLDLIFTPDALERFRAKYRIVEIDPDTIAALPAKRLAAARYIVGQPPLSRETLDRMKGCDASSTSRATSSTTCPMTCCSSAASMS